MKNFKILFSAITLLIGSSVIAQAQTPEKATSTKATSTKKESKSTMKDVSSTAKSFTAEMCRTLNITDKRLIQTISSINENYELTFLKSSEKSEMTPEQKDKLKMELESKRMKRFQGILSPTQLKKYQAWKAQKVVADKK